MIGYKFDSSMSYNVGSRYRYNDSVRDDITITITKPTNKTESKAQNNMRNKR